MSEPLEFIYKKEFWYISAFVNSKNADIDKKGKEIEDLFKKKVASITIADLGRVRGPDAENIKAAIVDMAQHASLHVRWIRFIEGFPYVDENTEYEYDMLGYFQAELEYYRDSPEKKAAITPLMIQQVPSIVLTMLQSHEKREENLDVNFDTESPIFVFATSDKTRPIEVSWSDENIKRHKRVLGNWIEIYSGAWPDYTEELYDQRIVHNLSNRLSELHFIKRNSGFIYMAEENYKMFFDSYMRQYVLDPTPRIRAILFALICINHSLDTLFIKRHTEFFDTETIEKKLNNLRFLRGVLQTKLSVMYDELDYNRRQHYTAVLTHLISEFGLDKIIARVNDKFETIYNTMQELYQKKTEEAQAETERGLKFLNLLFGLGVIANLGDNVLLLITGFYESAVPDVVVGLLVTSIITAVLLATVFAFMRAKVRGKKKGIARTVDAVISDGEGNVVLVKRDSPPFSGYYALPGRFVHVDEGESENVAIQKAITEKVGGKVRVEKKQGTYDEPGRDPRGRVSSTAFKCKLLSADGMKAELVPISKLKEMKLAFDHKQILKDVLKNL
ncbi:MAG: NUDIX hydrolase [Candidatus Lokiarchaeota archaeon]|nr:NUDIX hydrolase [Candidatus Lokiarchaeota archaeon]